MGWIIYYVQEYLPFLFSYYSVLMPLSVVYYCTVRNPYNRLGEHETGLGCEESSPLL